MDFFKLETFVNDDSWWIYPEGAGIFFPHYHQAIPGYPVRLDNGP